MAEKKAKEVKKSKSKRVWTNKREDLVSVEKTKESVKLKDKDGNLKGGIEFYGVPVEFNKPKEKK